MMHAITVPVALLLAGVAFVAATLAAVTGFGGAAVLLPVLVTVFGVREAIPILTVAQLIGNGSRVWFNRGELEWRVVGWFALGAVPFGFAGGLLLARAPLSALTRLLGAFLILVVVWRRLHPGPPRRPPLQSFAVIGAGASFLSALLGSVGPIMAPFFLAFGLVKGAYIGTEALSTVVMHVVKLVAYRQGSLLTGAAIIAGLALGPIMIAGSWAGKHIVDRLPEWVFVLLIELTLVAAGLLFLIRGS
ncbi:MAG TPA: sulfite exporter TauE/SafE family protein [Gemmatimonadaceae bacterium]|nr:sulfite exporter TauE/SafE family protein [Gemmatimonadaceae bacterium]